MRVGLLVKHLIVFFSQAIFVELGNFSPRNSRIFFWCCVSCLAIAFPHGFCFGGTIRGEWRPH